MQLVIKAYGKFFLEGLAVILLVGYLFGQIEDSDGNKGILHIVGANLEKERDNTTKYEDFVVFQAEGKKGVPIISYVASDVLYTGTYPLSECITAVDDANTALPVHLLGAWDPYGVEIDVTEQAARGELMFEYAGVYTVKVAAADAGNRRSVCLIRIPVNKREMKENL